jgi:hypothetical protein
MQIFVQTLKGKTITLNVSSTDSIDVVKCKIYNRIGIPTDNQRIVFSSNYLDGSKTLSHYNIKNESTIYMV